MFFFTRKSSSVSYADLLGFDFKRIDFKSIFPFESFATTSLAIAAGRKPPENLMLLNDSQGSVDPVFNQLLSLKQTELQATLQEQNSAIKAEAAWARDSALGDHFIYLHANSQMSDVLDAVFQSHVRQRRPILVNFERSPLFSDKPSRLTALMGRDALFHVNVVSLTGRHGQQAKRTAIRMLHASKVAYLGFEIGDFSILAQSKYNTLDETVVDLLAGQGKFKSEITV